MNFKIWLEKSETTSPDLFSKLKSMENPLAGVHFSKESYLRPNLRPHHNDPIGIYCFTKDYVLSNKLFANTGFSSMPYVFFIEPSPSAKILKLDMPKQQAESLLTQMGIDPKVMDQDISRGRTKTPGHLFWDAIETIRNGDNKLSKNMSWNTLFKKTGYNVIYDDGQGIIHSNEPFQIIYLDRTAYKIVDMIKNESENSLISRLASMFPDYKKKGNKKGWDNCQKITLSKDEHYITIQKCGNPWLYVTIGGFDEKFENSYKLEDIDLDVIKKEIEEFISTSTKTDWSKYRTKESDVGINLLKDIAKIYGFKQEDKYNIKRTYIYQGTKAVMHLTVQIDKISMSIKDNDRLSSFFYYSHYPLEEKQYDTREVVWNLIHAVRGEIEKDKVSDDSARRQWGADSANRFLDFLQKRVFIKRNI